MKFEWWYLLIIAVVAVGIWQMPNIKLPGQIVYDSSKPGMFIPDANVCGRGAGLCYTLWH
jgi:hypothetical protein